jgi:hypothetical protein
MRKKIGMKRAVRERNIAPVASLPATKREAFVQGSNAAKQSTWLHQWIASAFAKASADKSLHSQ